MTEEWALLGAIRANPDDSTPRLIYSDWLEEQGEEAWARLVRVQCRLAETIPLYADRAPLLDEEDELLRELRRTEALPRVHPGDGSILWDRGLIHLVMPQLPNPQHYHPRVAELSIRPGPAVETTLLPALRGEWRETLHRFNWLSRPNRPIRQAWARLRRELPPAIRMGTSTWDVSSLAAPEPPRKEESTGGGGGDAAGFVNSLGMAFKWLEPCEFRMGSPRGEVGHDGDEPTHLVRLTRRFAAGVHLVTRWHFGRLMTAEMPSFAETQDPLDGCKPVDNISWYQARSFCERLSEEPAELAMGRRYRLPTEAEWEFACRGGTRGRFCFGSDLEPWLANVQNQWPGPLPVGSFPPNPFGLHETHGQVREWCADWYERDYYAQSPEADPPGPTVPEGVDGSNKVMRGGSWDVSSLNYCRSAYRVYFNPAGRFAGIGFRVVCEAEE